MRKDVPRRRMAQGTTRRGSQADDSARLVVIGAGGDAKVVISTLRANGHLIAAVFDEDSSRWGTEILGVPVRGPTAIADQAGFELGIIAISDNAARKRIARSLNLRWLTLVHPAAWVDPEAQLG